MDKKYREEYISKINLSAGIVIRAKEILEDLEFNTTAISNAHNKELIYDLLLRHSIPYMAVQKDLFDNEINEDTVWVLAACLAAHTLALTHLDYHLDGINPDLVSGQVTAQKLSPETAISYAIRIIFKSGTLLSKTSVYGQIWSQCIDKVSGFVIERMHQDWKERYSSSILNTDPIEAIKDYLESATSKILASGYWEVMMKASFLTYRPNSQIPHDLEEVALEMRKFRQMIDELLDIKEDVSAGFVTLPVWFLINEKPDIRELVQEIWENTKEQNAVDTLLEELQNEFDTSLGAKEYLKQIENKYNLLVGICKRNNWQNLIEMINFKYAKIVDEIQ